jgi:hypothetical protein
MEAKAAAKVFLRHMLWICSDKGYGRKAGKRQPNNAKLTESDSRDVGGGILTPGTHVVTPQPECETSRQLASR